MVSATSATCACQKARLSALDKELPPQGTCRETGPSAVIRQYGREDVDYATWYSDWSKQLAKHYTRRELERRVGLASETASKAARTHLRAIQATHSMTSNSQRRAQSGNVVAAAGEEMMAVNGALEIYDLFPEHTKEAA
jgi:hypothetical protein